MAVLQTNHLCCKSDKLKLSAVSRLVIVARFTYSFVWAPSSQDTTAQWQPGGIEFPGTTRKLDADGVCP